MKVSHSAFIVSIVKNFSCGIDCAHHCSCSVHSRQVVSCIFWYDRATASLEILENCVNFFDVANGCAILLAWLVYKIFVLIPTRLKTAIFENTKFPIHPSAWIIKIIHNVTSYEDTFSNWWVQRRLPSSLSSEVATTHAVALQPVVARFEQEYHIFWAPPIYASADMYCADTGPAHWPATEPGSQLMSNIIPSLW